MRSRMMKLIMDLPGVPGPCTHTRLGFGTKGEGGIERESESEHGER